MSRKEELLKTIAEAQTELTAITRAEFEVLQASSKATLDVLVKSIKISLQEAVDIANNCNLTIDIEDLDSTNASFYHDGSVDWDSSSAYC